MAPVAKAALVIAPAASDDTFTLRRPPTAGTTCMTTSESSIPGAEARAMSGPVVAVSVAERS